MSTSHTTVYSLGIVREGRYGTMTGLLRARANASVAMGDDSVRIVVPMAIKKLGQGVSVDGSSKPSELTQMWQRNQPCIALKCASYRSGLGQI